jgi:Bacterial Ig-like domain (group 3)
MMIVSKRMARRLLVAPLGLILSGFAIVATTGAASATTAPGHTIASAGTLTMGPVASGGGGPIDFWDVPLSGGDEVQLLVTAPDAIPDGSGGSYQAFFYFELFPPGTTDGSFPQVAPVSSVTTYGTAVADLQAPYNGKFVLAVCENTNGDCRAVDSGSGLNPMQDYTFTPTLVSGGIPARVAAKETKGNPTIAGARTMGIGNFESGGGNPIDFWRVSLNKGDKVQFRTKEPPGIPDGSGGSYQTNFSFELFRPGTTDTTFPQRPPVAAAGTDGNASDVLVLTAPATGSFILAVCENANGDCRAVDSGSGTNPMQPYTFSTARIGGLESRTSLGLSAKSVIYGHEQTEKFSAAVSAQYGGSVTGTVGVWDGKKRVCAIKLSKGRGACALSAKALGPGAYKIAASYTGNKAPSTSGTAVLTVKR